MVPAMMPPPMPVKLFEFAAGVFEMKPLWFFGAIFVGKFVRFLIWAIITITYGVAKRNATEMAVTNRRVLIKTGMTSRRTLDLMLSRVESIGVEETAVGRMLGYGSVIVRGTGGTPEPFLMIAHPQEFRRAVQEQIANP